MSTEWGGFTDVVLPADGAGYAVAAGLEIRVTVGPDSGTHVIMDADRLTIGSADGNDMVLRDPSVSRCHCELGRGAQGILLRDLESTNGTFLDGYRVREVFLRPGARLRLGRSELSCVERDSVRLSLSTRTRFGELLGISAAMRRVFERLEALAQSDVSVLVQGESGTGKELVARALHYEGPRRNGPFHIVDCSAISPNVIESELFGHQKGAFTDAVTAREGAFQIADGGTLFLDELGELPVELQPKLLRVLESREVRPVGATRSRRVDVRLVAATHRDLRLEVNRKSFRADVYFRIAGATVDLPSLRERPDDIPLLVEHLVHELQEHYPNSPHLFVTAERLEEMQRYRWPGNVRELRNHLERAAVLTVNGALDPSLPPVVHSEGSEVDLRVPFTQAKAAWVERFERAYLGALVKKTGGNVSAAAREGRVDRPHLISLLRKHGIKP